MPTVHKIPTYDVVVYERTTKQITGVPLTGVTMTEASRYQAQFVRSGYANLSGLQIHLSGRNASGTELTIQVRNRATIIRPPRR